MSKDIVTRLREMITNLEKTVPQTLMIEAADEIERLRAEVNLWMKSAELFAESDPKFEAFWFYFRARTKAVRDE
jgi:hypothetical protein